ncbi:MAG: hypothetical protein A2Y28_01560 [Chlamydiae bacterium GWC2_50_10]|nr:MAG: hypothetical protein A2Z85_03660 [Chlamydiae bacterium GWA2_50_15]OGN54129.1 MAG: hypothetical protein A2Y28_01560 [Chlamydiae bacterium GWC2_50_10]OGN54681.1 MAG: hypothetical protein A2098_00690 [Chlamydiae bacterium GWF2_49_8]OGN57355.1 MAG: hypothetical protein A3D18_01845 [Chlamydiae bacterium RIFCSPHIGHO2_02_FULL_49_29]OGN72286.1 MAG: hypothetical protein A3G30_04190 [Chlamydiae bacterium RIFCSPLOWO2_12_FULL_49_12]HAZ15228.1 hypothetical protein [Parachlamydiales bacterium]
MESVTIDRLKIETHKRYAHTQATVDRSLIEESARISSQSEVTATTSTFSSQWKALFGLQQCRPPWAHFVPPPKFSLQVKRFFSYRTLPALFLPMHACSKSFHGKEGVIELKKLILCQQAPGKDKEVLTHFIETLFTLDEILGKILAKRLQYHKG